MTVRAGLLALRVRMVSPTAIAVLPKAVASVDGYDVLAYSCAAARDLHPLPFISCETRRANQGLKKSKKNVNEI